MERYEEAVFVAEHLCKEYRHTAALRDVTITIPRGQIYGPDRRERRRENHPAPDPVRADPPHPGGGWFCSARQTPPGRKKCAAGWAAWWTAPPYTLT